MLIVDVRHGPAKQSGKVWSIGLSSVASAFRGFRGERCPSLADCVMEPEGYLGGDRRVPTC